MSWFKRLYSPLDTKFFESRRIAQEYCDYCRRVNGVSLPKPVDECEIAEQCIWFKRNGERIHGYSLPVFKILGHGIDLSVLEKESSK
jgi:hypothetical protein